MVEFKVGPEGAHLMEINGRIWGSLPLAVRAGMDFPARLADLFLDGPPPGAARSTPVSRRRALPEPDPRGRVDRLGAAAPPPLPLPRAARREARSGAGSAAFARATATTSCAATTPAPA